MKQMLRGLAAILGLVLILATIGCKKPPEEWETGDNFIDNQIREFMKLDLKQEVEATRFQDPNDSNLATAVPRAFRQLYDPPLTDNEKRQLGAMITVDGTMTGSDACLNGLMGFIYREGHIPLNGAVLLGHMDERRFSNFLQAEPTEKLRMVFAGINPSTGKVFESFERSDWHPGGIYLEPCTDQKQIDKLNKGFEPFDRKIPMTYWKITFFGERPDHSVLATHYMVSGGKKIVRQGG